jgi:hypothetical protein
MIGDWLKHYNGIPMQVTKITTIHFACAENGGVNCWEYNNKFEPIPLTPEILKKNGFKKNISNTKMCLDIYEYSLIYNLTNRLFTIFNESEGAILVQKFTGTVHELQHTLKLCKIDKGIVI